MVKVPNKRQSDEPLPFSRSSIITWTSAYSDPAGGSLPKTKDVPLTDIQVVRPSGHGLLDIVYMVRRRLPSGITVNEIHSGETTVDQLLIALGWQPGMSHNEHLTEPPGFRFIT